VDFERIMKKYLLIAMLSTTCLVPVLARQPSRTAADAVTAPYSLNNCLGRAEELFRANNYREALIFYYEGMSMTSNEEVKARLHFRIGECLEAIRRFEFATYHYKMAVRGKLPELLVSRAIMKLEHLPELAQTEEATRLFKRSMELYRQRNIRAAIDDYLASLRLMPTLMAQDESGLIEDAVKYLTFLTESKEREPDRLLKLATLLELRGDVEKSVETLQQIVIIYPESDQARQADEKLEQFTRRRTAYVEPTRPASALQEVYGEEDILLFSETFDFRNAGTISRQLENSAFTLRAINERPGVPADRFEVFSITVGQGSEQRDFVFSAEEGIDQKNLSFSSAEVKYTIAFTSINQTRGFIQDLYGDGRRAVTLFSNVGVHLKIERRLD
jgi:tetratricopeptide (TPR) repeat protein